MGFSTTLLRGQYREALQAFKILQLPFARHIARRHMVQPRQAAERMGAVASLWSAIWSLPPRNAEDEIIDLTNGFKDRRPSGHLVLAVREKWLARISKAAA
ncbi:hypothetical protein ACETRX_12855 [Labrys portucalensis]|uniref:Uncharacterized protein n=1 Tax=Labrys neptuniae TaxID=376174 RepID=A0ABV6ZE83_9HYPH